MASAISFQLCVHAAGQQLLPRTAHDAEMDAAIARREVAREQRRTSERREWAAASSASRRSSPAWPRRAISMLAICNANSAGFADKSNVRKLNREKEQFRTALALGVVKVRRGLRFETA